MKTGITKGEWKVIKESNGELWIESESNVIANVSGDNYTNQGTVEQSDETQSNALLIADAGTTTNKCWLLPSELLKQRDELLEALKEVLPELKQWHGYNYDQTESFDGNERRMQEEVAFAIKEKIYLVEAAIKNATLTNQ